MILNHSTQTVTTRKEFLSQLIVFLFVLFSLLTLRTLSSNALLESGIDSYHIHTLLNLGANLILIGFSYYLIKKNGLEKLAGLKGAKLQRWYLLIFPLVYLVVLNLVINGNIRMPALTDLALAIVYLVSVGFAEELSVRGFMQSYLITHLSNSKKSIFLSVVISALFFGFVHLIKFDQGLYGELSQIAFATFIGAMFGAVLLVTKRLYPLIIIHTIVDIVGTLDKVGMPIQNELKDPWTLESAIIVATLTLPCLIYAIIILKKYPLNLN